jgi:hypothetical protein
MSPCQSLGSIGPDGDCAAFGLLWGNSLFRSLLLRSRSRQSVARDRVSRLPTIEQLFPLIPTFAQHVDIHLRVSVGSKLRAVSRSWSEPLGVR